VRHESEEVGGRDRWIRAEDVAERQPCLLPVQHRRDVLIDGFQPVAPALLAIFRWSRHERHPSGRGVTGGSQNPGTVQISGATTRDRLRGSVFTTGSTGPTETQLGAG